MIFILSVLLALWLAGAFFKILRGILQILLGVLALILGGALYSLATLTEIFVRILRTAFSSCN
jgi:hypothetical protein